MDRVTRVVCAGIILASLVVGCGSDDAAPHGPSFDLSSFRDPPRALAPRVRFWWPGGAVEDDVVVAELTAMAEAGYGAVELQTLILGLTQADIDADPRIRTVGDAGFLEQVRRFAEAAEAHGLRWDLTLGSGWPNGGPTVDAEAERQLLLASVGVEGPGEVTVPIPQPEIPVWVDQVNQILPAIGPFDEELQLVGVLAAADLGDGPPRGLFGPPVVPDPPTVLGETVDLSDAIDGDSITWQVPPGPHLLFSFHSNRVSHYALGHAFPGDPQRSLVVDHLDTAGIGELVSSQGDPWLDAVSDVLPETVFIDSFELVAELPWTQRFAEEFAFDHGYDLHPYLPLVFFEGGEAKYTEILRNADLLRFVDEDLELGERVREDYEDTRGRLFFESFVEPAVRWADRRGVALRLQAHGGYSDIVAAYGAAHVPESEGLYGRGPFDFLKLAASAAHIAGRSEVSSESFVLTHLVGTNPLALDELWLLAGRAYAAGITRLMHHGVAYPYERLGGQRWYPFQPGDDAITAGPLPITTDFRPGQPGFEYLADFNRAQNRISYAMSSGQHAASIAWLMSKRVFRDTPGLIAGPLVPGQWEDPLSVALRRGGHVYDRVSRAQLRDSSSAGGSLRVGQATYRLLVLSDLHAADPELLSAVEAALDAGVPVLVVGGLPARATGLSDREQRDAEVEDLVRRIEDRVVLVGSTEGVGAALAASGVEPALQVLAGEGVLSVERRRLGDEDLFFLFNESYESRSWQLALDETPREVQWLDPHSGEAVRLDGGGGRFSIALPPARGGVLWVQR